MMKTCHSDEISDAFADGPCHPREIRRIRENRCSEAFSTTSPSVWTLSVALASEKAIAVRFDKIPPWRASLVAAEAAY